MRLLNTTTVEFEEFFDENMPKYAILSHRWGQKEVSLQDFSDGKKRDGPGHAKIVDFCSVAREDGHDWVWIDTCCIDKKSSAELTEAINSMYRWYRKSSICYAYLVDVPSTGHTSREEAFCHSEWFTRGWTLQELLAPSQVVFCDRSWNKLGTKKGFNGVNTPLTYLIEEITGIGTDFVTGRRKTYTASVAARMSWASRRHTTRREDIAYCLLGLFDVNLPLLYGEGKKAFMRLQLEIIKHSDDETIFAWTSQDEKWGVLAPSPVEFRNSGHVFNLRSLVVPTAGRKPYSMTNKGLKLRLPSRENRDGSFDILLSCSNGRCGMCDPPPGKSGCEYVKHVGHVSICLRFHSSGRWVRIDCGQLRSEEDLDRFVEGREARYVHQPGLCS